MRKDEVSQDIFLFSIAGNLRSEIRKGRLGLQMFSATAILIKMACKTQECVLGHHVLHKEGFSFNRNGTGDLSSSDQ